MILIAGCVGFILALAIVGVIVLIKRKKESDLSYKPYKILVEIDGVKFVLDTLLLDMMKHGMLDDYGEQSIIMNNMMQQCYNVMAAGWKSEHKEKYARCGFLINDEDKLTYVITPLTITTHL